MIVDPPDCLISLTAAKTHKFVIITSVVGFEIFFLGHSFLVTKATDGMVEVIVNTMGGVIRGVTGETDPFVVQLLVKLLIVLPEKVIII